MNSQRHEMSKKTLYRQIRRELRKGYLFFSEIEGSMGMVNLYQVSVRNRVYHKYETKNGKKKYMRGQQGRWYSETFIVIANNETEAKRMVHEEIAK